MAAEGKKKTALGRNKFYDRLRQDPRIEERWDHKVLYFTGLKILPTPAWTYRLRPRRSSEGGFSGGHTAFFPNSGK
jgi:hypothetical protein